MPKQSWTIEIDFLCVSSSCQVCKTWKDGKKEQVRRHAPLKYSSRAGFTSGPTSRRRRFSQDLYRSRVRESAKDSALKTLPVIIEYITYLFNPNTVL